MRKQNNQKSKVSLNTLVKVRFEDGYEMIVSIFEKERTSESPGFQVNREAPLGKALLDHTVGEKIKYQVGDNIHQITILEIYNILNDMGSLQV